MNATAHIDMSMAYIIDENARLTAEIAGLRAQIADLERLADTDPLVALGNRRAFERAVTRAISSLSPRGAVAAILFIDLDGLKIVNDCYGHSAGDMMLRHVAGALAAADSTGFVARIGGDEFGMIIRAFDLADAQTQANQIARSVSATPVTFSNRGAPPVSIDCSVTIGVALAERGDSCESVIARADAAMYAQRWTR